jgi:hypothetical protein
MGWLRDPAWQQGIAIILAVGGATLIYRGASGTGEPGAAGVAGFIVLCAGIALPLVSEALRAHRENTAGTEDV